MYKRIIFLSVLFSIFFVDSFAFADVYINEVMYSSQGSGEWIEIFNNSNEPIDLTDWRFFNNNTESSPLRLQKGSVILPKEGYAIITSLLNVDSFIGTVFSSSQFSLPDDSSKYNTYRAISNPDKDIIDSITYDTSIGGGKDSGNSLSKMDNSWSAVAPTPNSSNNTLTTIVPQNTNNNQASYVEPQNDIKIKNKEKTEAPEIKTRIISQAVGFVGIPLSLEAKTLGYSQEILRNGKYYWNFGDGDSKEQLNNFDKFSHTYFYPGDYKITLEYYSNYYKEYPESVDEFSIKVLPLEILISNVGDENDFFVEITNKSSSKIDISRWVLSSLSKTFIFSKNTVIPANSNIIFSSHITKFSLGDKKYLKLLTPDYKIIFDYGLTYKDESNLISETKIETPIIKKEYKRDIIVNNNPDIDTKESEYYKEPIPLYEINEYNEEIKDSDNNYVFLILFVVLLVLASICVYFIRQKRNIKKDGDDFEILDE